MEESKGKREGDDGEMRRYTYRWYIPSCRILQTMTVQKAMAHLQSSSQSADGSLSRPEIFRHENGAAYQ